ncbi:hypothetical protein SAMN05421543_1496 [Alicyclobacillus macrosporangiidus]|uniref:Uncharacterized protein n=1 Tax=Alicyclobacillus macrosporangiidus TaxID=392015 RepID=A0A1I7LH22_9BACL|nr:hypothetical protein SAMN05421543_1496 [Alicyclobacillus macrosporangiidus]
MMPGSAPYTIDAMYIIVIYLYENKSILHVKEVSWCTNSSFLAS